MNVESGLNPRYWQVRALPAHAYSRHDLRLITDYTRDAVVDQKGLSYCADGLFDIQEEWEEAVLDRRAACLGRVFLVIFSSPALFFSNPPVGYWVMCLVAYTGSLLQLLYHRRREKRKFERLARYVRRIVGPEEFNFDPAWRTDTVVWLAQAISDYHDERVYLPLLKDALLDAGASEEFVAELDGPGCPRGTWFLFVILRGHKPTYPPETP